MSLLQCHGLTRRPFFARQDLEVRAGEIVTLSGPSGSGKTLFLRALADLDPVDEGEVLLRGRPRAAFPPTVWRARVLYVHQSGVRLEGTVEENVRRILALEAQEAHRDAAVAVPGVDPLGDALRLSGGEAQALALHRALCCAPEVLLLDEATSAMDPETAAGWEARIRAYAGGGRAVLWVAHDRALAGRVGARAEALS